MAKVNDYPTITFANQAEWEAWLEANHANAQGVWIKIAKKSSGIPSIDHAAALDSALCFGWIDGQRNGLDDQFFLQKFTPRRAKSTWSKVNVAKIEALTAAGRMRPAGIAEVERAKADGRWAAAYESQKNMTVPEDFQAALEASPTALEFFKGLNSQNRFALLFRIQSVKRAETRAAKIRQFVEMLERGEKIYP